MLSLVAACDGPGYARVEGVLLTQAWGVYPVELQNAPVLTLTSSEGDLPAIPKEGKKINLAVASNVPWHRVDTLLSRLEAEDTEVTILVGKRRHVKGFPLSDAIEPPSIALTATMDGKACVSPPGVALAKCVQSSDKMHIEAAFTRELVREAMKGYRLAKVNVEVPRDLPWGDVVRTIDAARTCCGETRMRVFLNR